jgi:hypothetical protein
MTASQVKTKQLGRRGDEGRVHADVGESSRRHERRGLMGNFEWISIASFAGMPYDQVQKSMRLLGKEVLPEVRRWGAA